MARRLIKVGRKSTKRPIRSASAKKPSVKRRSSKAGTKRKLNRTIQRMRGVQRIKDGARSANRKKSR